MIKNFSLGGKNYKHGIYVTTEGFEEVQRTLLKMRNSAGPELQKALVKEAKIIKELSRLMTPIKTGRLHDSTRVVTGGAVPKKGYIVVQVIAGGIMVRGIMVNYAALVHETHRSKSHFLLKALKLRERGFEQRVKTNVKKFLRDSRSR
jgi:hypothetical protein